MTTLPFNIEKSAFRQDEYVGYAAGYVFRIVKSNSSFGNWHAQLARFNPVNPRLSSRIFYGFTLAELSQRLDDISKEIEKIAIVEIPAA
jgi:hypothetical protein